MKKLWLGLAFVLFPILVSAGELTVFLPPYSTPDGHNLRIFCSVNSDPWERWVTVPASSKSITKEFRGKVGDAIRCKDHVRRISDSADSDFSSILSFTLKPPVKVPGKITGVRWVE